MKVFLYFTKSVLVGILIGWLIIIVGFQNDRLNLSTVVTPSAKPIVPARKINYLKDDQDIRMFDSANERAQCISSGSCEFSHDGWTTFVGSHVQYTRAGEVLGRDFENWDQVFTAWNASATHRDVLEANWCIYGKARSADIFVVHVACE